MSTEQTVTLHLELDVEDAMKKLDVLLEKARELESLRN